MRKVRTLMGRLNGLQTLQVIKNDLANVAWKITKFQIYAKTGVTVGALPIGARLCTDMRGLTTQVSSGAANLDWDRGSVLAISNMGPAGQFEIIDPGNYVVQDLFVDNSFNESIYFLIEMELYNISSDEQIIYQLKQIGQDAE